MTHRLVDVANRFADALDAEDYAAARGLLAETCIYRLNNDTLIGPAAIIESYRSHGESAKRRFDSIEYLSHVEPSGPASAVISFTDRLRLGDAVHEFRCRQHVRIGMSGLIEEIAHEELPEERQRLRGFEARRRRAQL